MKEIIDLIFTCTQPDFVDYVENYDDDMKGYLSSLEEDELCDFFWCAFNYTIDDEIYLENMLNKLSDKAKEKLLKERFFEADIAFTLNNIDELSSASDLIRSIAEVHDGTFVSAGCGFGARDMQFIFKEKQNKENFLNGCRSLKDISWEHLP